MLPSVIFPGGPRIRTANALYDHLRAQIVDGDIQPGHRLPAEVALMQTYGLARGTVAKAVKMLRNEGLATFVQGYGVVVREHTDRQDVVVEAGQAVEIRMPSREEREAYEIDEGVPLFIVIGGSGEGQAYPADKFRIVIASAE